MTRSVFLLFLALAVGSSQAVSQDQEVLSKLKPGDILFQNTGTELFREATNSDITHMGMLARHDGEWVVLQAFNKVERTPLQQFLRQGAGWRVTIKRLKEPVKIEPVIKAAESYLGQRYDNSFQWNDKASRAQYCSELVHKAYAQGAGVSLGDVVPVHSLDFSSEVVLKTGIIRAAGTRHLKRMDAIAKLVAKHGSMSKLIASGDWAKVKQWLGKDFNRFEEMISSDLVTPISLHDSPLLEEVWSNMP